MANMENQVENKFNRSGERAAEGINTLMQSAEEMSQRMKSSIDQASSEIASRANEYIKQGRDQVRQKPLQSVAVVAAAGFVAGILFMAMRRAREA